MADNGLGWKLELPGDVVLSFQAEALRKERSGVHARVSILANGQLLASDNFNVEKDVERGRLSNKAHAALAGAPTVSYKKDALALDFSDWCLSLWDRYTATEVAAPLSGTSVYQPPRPLLFPYISAGGGTIVFAAPGSGKSYLMLLQAASVHSGVSALWPVEQARVLFINLERSAASMRNRLGAVNRSLGLPSETSIPFMNCRGRSLADILGAARRSVEENGTEVVFLDSLSRLGAGDLTENGPANQAMDNLNLLAPSWAAIGHTPRESGDHLFGSQMFDAAADTMVKVGSQRTGQYLGLALDVTKANDLGIVPRSIISLEFGPGMGLIRARKASPGEFLTLENPDAPSGPLGRSDNVAAYLGRHGAAPFADIQAATALGRQELDDVLATPRFVKLKRAEGGWLYGLGGKST